MQRSAIGTLICIFLLITAVAQEPAKEPASPQLTVTKFACPEYPAEAESVHLQGMVVLEVGTDGHRVSSVRLKSGHPLLIGEAIKNVKTWEFADHAPTSFVVHYHYVNEGNYKRDPATKCSAKMDLPRTVKVSTKFIFH